MKLLVILSLVVFLNACKKRNPNQKVNLIKEHYKHHYYVIYEFHKEKPKIKDSKNK